MAIPRKPLDECNTVQITLCGEAKKKVVEFQDRYKTKTGRVLSYPLAIIKMILGCDENKILE